MLNTGIFQLLPYSAYHRQMNNFQNRFSASVSELDLFPSLDEAKEGFNLKFITSVAWRSQMVILVMEY
ncbi:hypothetical protein [Nostoc commune]|uniref:hypothetical protein n=1 Tax=Nostoc commune TaxID=1178 RepID=UPI0020742B49|nr:hypothetical protein [Nostoc commune]